VYVRVLRGRVDDEELAALVVALWQRATGTATRRGRRPHRWLAYHAPYASPRSWQHAARHSPGIGPDDE